MSFGKYLRAEREAREIRLGDLARRVEISVPYLSRIERDRENVPRDHLLSALAAALGIPEDTMFAQAERLPPDLRSKAEEVITLFRRQSDCEVINGVGV